MISFPSVIVVLFIQVTVVDGCSAPGSFHDVLLRDGMNRIAQQVILVVYLLDFYVLVFREPIEILRLKGWLASEYFDDHGKYFRVLYCWFLLFILLTSVSINLPDSCLYKSMGFLVSWWINPFGARYCFSPHLTPGKGLKE